MYEGTRNDECEARMQLMTNKVPNASALFGVLSPP